jgi:hypothetical protein
VRSDALARDLLLWKEEVFLPEADMRVFTVGIAVVAFSAVALGQAGVRPVPSYCSNNCGPYIPQISTPSVRFETVSPSGAGASNSTGGMHAGARNSTLSIVDGNPDAVHTQVVWYSGGGSPLVSPAVRLPHAEGPMAMHAEHMMHMEHEQGEEAHQVWTYYAGRAESASPVEASAAEKSGRHAARTYTNADVERVGQISQEFKKK